MDRSRLYFKTNTLLKNLIGKDLINDDNIAIVELVKNAYDAGSETVQVRFDEFNSRESPSNASRIVISDTGSGMDLNDIKDKWLNIAYSEKKGIQPENGAFLAGNKGIGRFSCDRLGDKLHLLTRAQGGELLNLEINWLDFEIEGEKNLTIQEVPLDIVTISEKKALDLSGLDVFPKSGTTLVISGLRSKWDRDKLLVLKQSLERFLNPNQLFQRKKFRIFLSVPGIKSEDRGKPYPEKINVEIENQIFGKLEFNATYINSAILPDDNTIHTELYHEGEPVFRLVERNTAYQHLKDARAVIYYLNPYKKAYFSRQTGRRLVDFGSIFLFLNGFRIAPYGDRGDDWLGLDVRKAQGTARFLGSRDIVGRIEVKGNEDDFKPVSSREGLKKTVALEQLRQCYALDVLKKLELFVVAGLQWDSVPATVRNELSRQEGIDWKKTSEQYVESYERKRQRIALSILTLIGADPEKIVSFWFNPSLLDEVYQSRTDEVKNLLANVEGMDPDKIDANLKRGLSRIRNLIVKKEEEAKAAEREAANLRVAATKQKQKYAKLKEEKATYQAQTLFLQSVSSLDTKELLAFHHQIVQDSTIVNGFLAKSIKKLQEMSDGKPAIEYLVKAVLANNRIAAVAQFATKANFRAGIKQEVTDVPPFIDQYIKHVAKDFIATSLRVNVVNKVNELFELKLSRVEMSILIDNIISNANKAQATHLEVVIEKIKGNTLRISFIDDGGGLSKKLDNPEAMFAMGVTTTSGSGLGLYHCREIVNRMGGRISAIPAEPKGMEIRIEVTR